MYINIFIYIQCLFIFMTSRTTVAIDDKLRKRLKKLAAWLDITQAEVIKQAISLYENEMFKSEKNQKRQKISESNSSVSLKMLLEEATKKIWDQDPERKSLQLKLLTKQDKLDEFILNNWDLGVNQ